MVKLDHIRIAVKDYRTSRDWYRETIGLKLEFERARRHVVALGDDFGVTLLLEQTKGKRAVGSCILYFQVDDVFAVYKHLSAAGVLFVHPPSKRFWGFGAELADPDGYRVRLWDETSMVERG